MRASHIKTATSKLEIMVPRRHRIFYGVSEIGMSGADVLMRISLLIFYTDVVGLRADYAGYVIALAVLWDGFTDPLMGFISDNFPIRGQKRRPYILMGAFALALGISLLFTVPSYEGQLAKAIYLLMTYMLANTGMTILAIPHAALGGDIPLKGHERAELFGWRLFFGNLGLTLGIGLPGLLAVFLVLAPSTGGAENYSSRIMAITIIITTLVTLYFTKSYDKNPKKPGAPSSKNYGSDLKSVLRNKAFRPVFIAYIIATLGLSLNSTFALYYYKYRLQLDEESFRAIIFVFMLVFSLSLPLWVWLSKKFAKKNLISLGVLGLGFMSIVVYPLIPIKSVSGPMLAAIIGGILIGSVVLMDTALADMVDRQEPGSENHKFGLYFGFWKLGGKISRALAITLAGQLLFFINFMPNKEQTSEASLALAMIFGPMVGSLLVISGMVIYLFMKDELKA